jgi:hypothetical protein
MAIKILIGQNRDWKAPSAALPSLKAGKQKAGKQKQGKRRGCMLHSLPTTRTKDISVRTLLSLSLSTCRSFVLSREEIFFLWQQQQQQQYQPQHIIASTRHYSKNDLQTYNLDLCDPLVVSPSLELGLVSSSPETKLLVVFEFSKI